MLGVSRGQTGGPTRWLVVRQEVRSLQNSDWTGLLLPGAPHLQANQLLQQQRGSVVHRRLVWLASLSSDVL